MANNRVNRTGFSSGRFTASLLPGTFAEGVGMNKPFQRKGATSNTQVGRDFEARAKSFFAGRGVRLSSGVSVPIGINGTKLHQFDLGDTDRKVLVECKAHTWTENYNIPSAKITTWNQAMYYFYAAPSGYRKILFILRHLCERRNETLGQYYIRINSHLIPADVEIWEFDEVRDTAERIR
jgi:hypothetical protein